MVLSQKMSRLGFWGARGQNSLFLVEFASFSYGSRRRHQHGPTSDAKNIVATYRYRTSLVFLTRYVPVRCNGHTKGTRLCTIFQMDWYVLSISAFHSSDSLQCIQVDHEPTTNNDQEQTTENV
jgi:hypothetical protein